MVLNHRGFSAWINDEGNRRVPEFMTAVDDKSKSASCWIPSIPNQKFSIHWKDNGGQIDTCSFIALDGFVVPGRFLFGQGVTNRSGVRDSLFTERPFIFQSVTPSAGGDGTGNPAVGTIVLKIKRVRRLAGYHKANPVQQLPIPAEPTPLDLQVTFGDSQRTYQQYQTTWSVQAYEPTDPPSRPSTYVTFVFRYRTADFLRSQGIMPREMVPRSSMALPPRPASVLSAHSRGNPREGSKGSPPRIRVVSAQRKNILPPVNVHQKTNNQNVRPSAHHTDFPGQMNMHLGTSFQKATGPAVSAQGVIIPEYAQAPRLFLHTPPETPDTPGSNASPSNTSTD